MVGCLLSLLQLKGETKHNRNKRDSEKKFKLHINGREPNTTEEVWGRFTERGETKKNKNFETRTGQNGATGEESVTAIIATENFAQPTKCHGNAEGAEGAPRGRRVGTRTRKKSRKVPAMNPRSNRGTKNESTRSKAKVTGKLKCATAINYRRLIPCIFKAARFVSSRDHYVVAYIPRWRIIPITSKI